MLAMMNSAAARDQTGSLSDDIAIKLIEIV